MFLPKNVFLGFPCCQYQMAPNWSTLVGIPSYIQNVAQLTIGCYRYIHHKPNHYPSQIHQLIYWLGAGMVIVPCYHLSPQDWMYLVYLLMMIPPRQPSLPNNNHKMLVNNPPRNYFWYFPTPVTISMIYVFVLKYSYMKHISICAHM